MSVSREIKIKMRLIRLPNEGWSIIGKKAEMALSPMSYGLTILTFSLL